MITVEKLKAEHVLSITPQPAQIQMVSELTESYAAQLENQPGVAFSVMLDGEAIACGGLAEIHDDRAVAWSLISEAALSHFKIVHRVVLRVMQSSHFSRIEMVVNADHKQAKRWAQSMGFTQEALMRKFNDDGSDAYLFSRIR